LLTQWDGELKQFNALQTERTLLEENIKKQLQVLTEEPNEGVKGKESENIDKKCIEDWGAVKTQFDAAMQTQQKWFDMFKGHQEQWLKVELLQINVEHAMEKCKLNDIKDVQEKDKQQKVSKRFKSLKVQDSVFD